MIYKPGDKVTLLFRNSDNLDVRFFLIPYRGNNEDTTFDDTSLSLIIGGSFELENDEGEIIYQDTINPEWYVVKLNNYRFSGNQQLLIHEDTFIKKEYNCKLALELIKKLNI